MSSNSRPPLEMDVDEARSAISERLLLALSVARHARTKVKPGGTLLFMSGTGARRPVPGSRSCRP